MPKRTGKEVDDEYVELGTRSPMMGTKANASRKKENHQNASEQAANKQNIDKTRKINNKEKSTKHNKSNGVNSRQNEYQNNPIYTKERNGDNKTRTSQENGAKRTTESRKAGNLNGKSNHVTDNDRQNGEKKEMEPMLKTKDMDKEGHMIDKNENSSKKSYFRRHKKQLCLICFLVLIIILLLSILIAIIVWKVIMDPGPRGVIEVTSRPANNTHHNSVLQVDFDVHLNQSYVHDLSDEDSQAYKDLSRQFLTQINGLFDGGRLSRIYMYTVVSHFRPGSVVVSSFSYFSNAISTSNQDEEDYMNRVEADVENALIEGVVNDGVLGPLADGTNSIRIKKPRLVEESSIKEDQYSIFWEVTTPKKRWWASTEEPQTRKDASTTSKSASTPLFIEPTPLSSNACGIRPGLRRRRKRVVGGTDSPFGSMPWIGSVRRSPDGHYCGATLVNSQWAVTAAHCLGNTDDVVFGDLYLDWPSDFHEQVNLSAVFPHPDYDIRSDRTDKSNDIALLRLSRPVKMSSAIRPACIASSNTELHDYRRCTAAGWGISDYRDANTNRLQEVRLPLVPMNDCRTFYADSPHVLPDEDSSLSLSSDQELHMPIGLQSNKSESVVSDRMICAGGYPEGGKGICRADQGGPLVCLGEDDLWYIVGVGSWSWGCDLPNIPNVFARVSVFKDFIENTIKRTEDCVNDESKTSCFDGCVGGEDCLKQCNADDFLCQAGYCIPGNLACDNVENCADGSDERDYAGCLDDCGDSMITIQSGITKTITSPGYPIVYPDFHRCQWQLTASNSARLRIVFVDFALETDYDFLHVATGLAKSDYLFSLTGPDPQLDIISPGQTLVLTFSSDESTGERGFVLDVTETSVTEFDSCDNGVQVIPTDRIIICNDIIECADSSDEPSTCVNPGRQDQCGRSSFQVSPGFPANITYIDYPNVAKCKWIVNADDVSARLRVTFLKFSLESNYDYLTISSSATDDAEKLSYTGHKMPPDVISPRASLVIGFETDATGTDDGFLLQVSYLREDDDVLQDMNVCANGREVISNDVRCDGFYDCQDQSDEVPGCACGDSLLTIPPNGSITLTSYKYPLKYHRSMNCQWTVRTQSGGKIAAKFTDFSLERNYDYLHIGTVQQPMKFNYTGNVLPLNIVSTGSELIVNFETDYSISDRGFAMVMENAENTSGFKFCNNGMEVLSSIGKHGRKCHD